MFQHMMLQRVRPALPVDLIDISSEKYEELLRSLGYSDRLIRKELEILAKFQSRYAQPSRVGAESSVTDAQNPMAAAFLRRKRRRVSETEEPDGPQAV
jgi:hypothetical protein